MFKYAFNATKWLKISINYLKFCLGVWLLFYEIDWLWNAVLTLLLSCLSPKTGFSSPSHTLGEFRETKTRMTRSREKAKGEGRAFKGWFIFYFLQTCTWNHRVSGPWHRKRRGTPCTEQRWKYSRFPTGVIVWSCSLPDIHPTTGTQSKRSR